MTIEQVKKLNYGDIVHYGTCMQFIGPRGGITENTNKWRVTGKVKTWKRNVNRVRVPVKHGMYENWYIDEFNCESFHLESKCIPYCRMPYVKKEVKS